MLILANNGNWEKSERTSLTIPEPKFDGGTLFIPVNIRAVDMATMDGEGNDSETVGYSFSEYRINRPVALPQEALDAYHHTLSSMLA